MILAEYVNLYLDTETRKVFTQEAHAVGLSFSAYLRVLGRAFVAWSTSQTNTPMDELRERVREIMRDEERRV